MKRLTALLIAALFLSPGPALAWGTKGHEIIGELAVGAFPLDMPAFTRTPAATYEIMYLGPEMDRLKGSGNAWDAENDPGHYIDLDDNAMIAGVVSLQKLPMSREAYDTALRAAGTDQYRQGYSPYAIVEGWQQLRDDFAYWRVDNYYASHAATAAARTQATTDRGIDQMLVLRDVGVWGHFVEDACQPLHVTIHFNGWGKYPNPDGFTESYQTHSFFESTFVDRHVSIAQVRQLMKAPAVTAPGVLMTQDQTMANVADYINGSLQAVRPLYVIEKAGGFAQGMPEAVTFAASQLARGADELRDLVTLAWYDSLNEKVGYPYQSVRDILNGAPPPKGSSD